MADKFIEHGKYPAYSATPGWGLCQEGDGAVNGLAVSAIASILFSAFDNTTGSISVMGVSVAPTFGTSADAQANTLAAAINASSTAVNAGTTPNGTQLRDLVFARGPAGGAPAGTCQIMTRAGSATLNYSTNTSVGITHSLNGTAPTITQFAGGVSGSWGYFVNTAVIWPSAKAIANYGPWWAKPLCGDIVQGDNVYIRTALNGSPIFLQLDLAGNPPSWRHYGLTSRVKFIFNSNDAWPETNGRLTLRYHPSGEYVTVTQIAATASNGTGKGLGNRIYVGGICSTDGDPNFGIENYNDMYSTNVSMQVAAARDRFDTVFFAHGSRAGSEAMYSPSYPVIFIGDSTGTPAYSQDLRVHLENCLFIVKQITNGTINDLTSDYAVSLIDCTVRGIGVSSITSAGNGGLIRTMSYAAGPNDFIVKGLKLEGIPANSPLLVTSGNYISTARVSVEDSSLSNLEGTQGTCIDNTNNIKSNFDLFASSSGAAFPFILENLSRSAYWLPTKGQPTLNALTPDGYAMSVAVQVSTNSDLIGPLRPISVPKMAYLNPIADGIRNVVVNFLADKTKTLSTSDVYMIVGYTEAATGKQKTVSTRLRQSAVFNPVASLSPDWSQTKNDGTGEILPYMTIGADKFYRRYQLTVTTPTAAKQNTAITVRVLIERPNVTNTERYIFCPEVLVS